MLTKIFFNTIDQSVPLSHYIPDKFFQQLQLTGEKRGWRKGYRLFRLTISSNVADLHGLELDPGSQMWSPRKEKWRAFIVWRSLWRAGGFWSFNQRDKRGVTEANGGSRSTNERGPSLVGPLAFSCQYRDFCPALAALVGQAQNLVFLAV